MIKVLLYDLQYIRETLYALNKDSVFSPFKNPKSIRDLSKMIAHLPLSGFNLREYRNYFIIFFYLFLAKIHLYANRIYM